ncbi:B3 domain-containing protein Os03g0619800-like [Papaver somniferum]|nr:B3 domain-containing protein Os03g0619800-like [Papaver somniferum]
MEFYSISAGHLLVFRYDGNSTFHVLIFTMSATEIEYPMRSFKTMFKGKAQVIDIDSCSSDSNNENSTQSEPSSSRDSQVNLETEPVDEHDYPKRRKVSAATKRFNTSRVTQLKERALRAAEAFRSEEPFFKAIMHASCVKTGGNMHVPSDFAIPYLQHKTTRVTLRVSDGKSWDVGVLYTQSFYKTTLSKGWPKFALDNHLNTGDVCVFELVDRKKFEINVHIFQVFKTNFRDEAQVIRIDPCSTRSNNETSTQSSSTRGGQVNLETEEPVFCSNVTQSKERALAAAEAFTSDNPFFKAIMCPFNISNGVVNIPGNFATPYLKHKTALVTLSVSDGKLWDVILTSINSGTTTLSNGWKQFVSDNQLNQGDVCVFELVDRKYFVMNVHIFRVFQKTCSSSEKLEIDAPRAGRSKEKSLAAANAFKSKKPYFKMVPAAFSVPYLKHETKVRLRGVDGKTWEMQCNLLHKPDRAKLFKG